MRAPLILAGGALAVAAASPFVVPAAPDYDPWAWLLWGREVAGGSLSTAEGPAFKPLPVAVCALLAPLGEAAPGVWLVVARAGALLAVALAFAVARAAVGRGAAAWIAGGCAAVAVALAGAFPTLAASGGSEGWAAALALLAVHRGIAGDHRVALLAAAGCALLRVEAWPLLAVHGAWLWRRAPAERRLIAVLAVAVPAAWFVPEWLASGDPLRSASRAREPNPGQPVLADVPALESLRRSADLLPLPLWAGVAAVLVLRRPAGAAVPVALGLAWVGVVAAMAQAGGFSGEPRYALPGVALLAAGGAAGLVEALPRARRAMAPAAAALVLIAVLPAAADLPERRAALRWSADMANDLRSAVARAGGRDAVLRCGSPVVGRYRGPLLAWRLRIEKRRVAFAAADRGVVFRSRLTRTSPRAPSIPAGFAPRARAGTWEVFEACPRRGRQQAPPRDMR